jgi:hypothetical protein
MRVRVSPPVLVMDFPYGPVIDHLPNGFIPKEQWPEYDLRAEPVPICKREIVGTNPKGIRWWLGPLCFEEYVSDTEPDLAMSDSGTIRIRQIRWLRVINSSQPKGWHQLSKKPSRLEGFGEVKEGYWRNWSESARRYRKKWHTSYHNSLYTIENVSYQEYAQAYATSTVSKSTAGTSLLITTQHAKYRPGDMEFLAARRLIDGKVMAGIALAHSPSTGNSLYLSGFYQESVKEDPLMVGLMDHWYHTSVERHFLYLHFGGFWIPGTPKSAQGYSTFKAKFGLSYIAYPPELMRVRAGRIF